MRREFRRLPPKRQACPVTGLKALRRHRAGRAQKARPWAAWLRREAISAIGGDDRRGGPLS
jgi:hypothetical protein